MAKDPSDPTVRILQDIQEKISDVQAKLTDHDRRFERMQQQMDYRFGGVERKLGGLIDSTAKALGTAAIANVRHDSASQHFAEMELELRDLPARLQWLEEKV